MWSSQTTLECLHSLQLLKNTGALWKCKEYPKMYAKDGASLVACLRW